MKGFIISSSLAILLSFNALAQNINGLNISSQVVDGNTGEPVEYACVSNLNHTFGFMADADGRFTLTEKDLADNENDKSKSQAKNPQLL